MSTITGTIRGNTGQVVASVPVVFKYQSNPAVASGAAVYAPDLTENTDELGQFSQALNMGKWQMTVGGVVVYTLVVPDDDNTYDFTEVLDPVSPVTQSVANPLAVLGLHIRENINSLRNVTNNASNRFAVLYSPVNPETQFYRWDQSSFAVDDGTNNTSAVRTTDTDEDEPGRFLIIPIVVSGVAGQSGYVASMAALKAIPSSASNSTRLVMDVEAPHKMWAYYHGESATPVDDVNIVRANDNLGNWHGIL